MIDRAAGAIIEHVSAPRTDSFSMTDGGINRQELEAAQRDAPPLSQDEVEAVIAVANHAEEMFGEPQDVEWTIKDGGIYVLQSRPITTMKKDDGRAQYLRLRRSFENLERLLERVENHLIPALQDDIAQLEQEEVTTLGDAALADALRERAELFAHWNDIYIDDFIPLAHGTRLFGEVYNDVMTPDDPFAFTTLLAGTQPLSVQRNQLLEQLAESHANRGEWSSDVDKEQLDALIDDFYESISSGNRDAVIRLIGEMSSQSINVATDDLARRQELEAHFIGQFPPGKQQWARELLKLARRSYRLRDDDNIYMAKLEAQLAAARREAVHRITRTGRKASPAVADEELITALTDPAYQPSMPQDTVAKAVRGPTVRRYRGQPASEGAVSGSARVVNQKKDIFQFKKDEILVCDAIDPTMTIAVPLAAGIVERRGGMLIHGAIVAREYGIPCVTGIANATEIIDTGDRVSVDGFSGVVTVHKKDGAGWLGDVE